jgi:diguanylate cyclase (GGDEF)-like protein
MMTGPIDQAERSDLLSHQRLLDAVVNLTAQRDQEALADVLVRELRDITAANAVSVYALQGELGHPSAKVLASADAQHPKGSHITSLNSHPALRACIEEQHPVFTQRDGAGDCVYPVLAQSNVMGLVMLRDLAPDATKLMESLIGIYANQYSLLNHQQRDGLTGLFNRVALQNWLGKALAPSHPSDRRAADTETPGCFAMFDIDHFKRINDSLGHLYGDEVLLIFTDLMRESFRFNDLLFRYGGEEFVAVLGDTDLDTALMVLERFRTTVAQHKFPQINQVTVTVGVTQIEPRLLPTTLIDRADKALYYGKNHGRDQVNAFEWLERGRIVSKPGEQPQNIELFT